MPIGLEKEGTVSDFRFRLLLRFCFPMPKGLKNVAGVVSFFRRASPRTLQERWRSKKQRQPKVAALKHGQKGLKS